MNQFPSLIASTRLRLVGLAGCILLAAGIYKRWSDDVAWAVCRTAGWGYLAGSLPVRADSFAIAGWAEVREISAVYRVEGTRYYIGCTMTWSYQYGWVPHDLIGPGVWISSGDRSPSR
jgi:hypothetical protein